MKARYLLFFFLMLLGTGARAQFHITGDEPRSLNWYRIDTRNYRIIYPAGMDSLARVYAGNLEKFREPVGRSTAWAPNEQYRKKMPVILHAAASLANGQVTWAPRRMDLYTVQDPDQPLPTPWVRDLVIHESRHVAQMQLGNASTYRIFSLLLGEMWPGAMSAVYGGPAFLEGDAVVAETALSRSGRGRAADFLEYYRVALDQGDWRNFYRWRYGSIKHYTPDYYKVGYLTVAGIRAFYDDPLFTQRFYTNIFRRKAWPFAWRNLDRTAAQASGLSFARTFRAIEEKFRDMWAEDAAGRAPFMPAEAFTAPGRRHEEYTRTTLADGRLVAVKEGLETATKLVDLDAGRTLRAFSPNTGDLHWSAPLGRLVWSEVVSDPRWTLRQSARIVLMNPATGRKDYLNRTGRYFNPAPSPTDLRIAVTSYPMEGGSALLVLDGRSGEIAGAWPAPDSLQVLESTWLDGRLYASAVSEAGAGLYAVEDGYACLLAPQPVKIHHLRTREGRLFFVSDRNGVNELYGFDPASRRLYQYSNTRYGASDFVFRADSLYYSAMTPEGRMVFRTAVSDLPVCEVSFAGIHHDRVADKLSAQEASLAPVAPQLPTVISQPVRYRKLLHPGRIHSWAPVYVDSDEIQEISTDIESYLGLLGATAFFQNDLGSSSGSIGYSYSGKGIHNGYLKHTYRGLYPIIETRLHFSNAGHTHYVQREVRSARTISASFASRKAEGLGIDGSVLLYVPLNFSRGGWRTGLIPQLRWRFTNDDMDTGAYTLRQENSFLLTPGTFYSLLGYSAGRHVLMQSLSASLRAYTTLPIAPAGVFPRLGIGTELGYNARLGLKDLFSPNAYFYLYGYLPGILPEHGLKLTVMGQHRFTEGSRYQESYVNVLPRGLSSRSGILLTGYGEFHDQLRLTADYAMALAAVDWTFLCPVAYIRNFVLTPHFDCTLFAGATGRKENPGALCSAGTEFYAQLANLLWIPFDTKVGLTWSYNFGPGFDTLRARGTALDRHYVGMIFSIDL